MRSDGMGPRRRESEEWMEAETIVKRDESLTGRAPHEVVDGGEDGDMAAVDGGPHREEGVVATDGALEPETAVGCVEDVHKGMRRVRLREAGMQRGRGDAGARRDKGGDGEAARHRQNLGDEADGSPEVALDLGPVSVVADVVWVHVGLELAKVKVVSKAFARAGGTARTDDAHAAVLKESLPNQGREREQGRGGITSWICDQARVGGGGTLQLTQRVVDRRSVSMRVGEIHHARNPALHQNAGPRARRSGGQRERHSVHLQEWGKFRGGARDLVATGMLMKPKYRVLSEQRSEDLTCISAASYKADRSCL